jgi:hypothetical protein
MEENMRKADEPREPWERRPGETSKSFAAFAVYRDLGPERSLSKVAKRLSKRVEQMKRWSRENDWKARADQFDHHIDVEVRREALARATEERRVWEEMGQHHRVQMIVAAEAMWERANQLLSWPVSEQTVREDKNGRQSSTTISPAKWSLDTVVRLFKFSHSLQSEAMEMMSAEARSQSTFQRTAAELGVSTETLARTLSALERGVDLGPILEEVDRLYGRGPIASSL